MLEVPQVEKQLTPDVAKNSVEAFVPGVALEQGNPVAQETQQPENKSVELPSKVTTTTEVSVLPEKILGYEVLANLELNGNLTAGEFAATLASQKAHNVNIEDLPLAV